MKKLLLALGLSFALCSSAFSQGQSIGPANYPICNQIATFTGTAALAKVISSVLTPVGPGGVLPRIYICGWQYTNSAASGTVLLQYGSGTNCGTNTTTLIPVTNVGATAVTVYTSNPSITVPIVTAAPNWDICQNSTATVTGVLWFSQF